MEPQTEALELKQWLEETRDEPLEAMSAFFDRRIEDYEEHMSPWKKHYQWMAGLIPPSARTLLDIGCGTGLELDEIFSRMPGLQVTGIDLSAEMLAVLKQKHSGKPLTLIRDDYFRYDFGENRFDAAVSFETLHHFAAEKKEEVFRKICRSLVPGGVYLECDYIAVSQQIEDLLFAECERRRRRDGIAPGVFVHFDTPLTLEHEIQAIRRAGFRSVEPLGFLPGDGHTVMIRAVR
ncbi:MAG: class I SAM-dependent methyltransferase [Firmicutes bacterium]|nr:class I SAM-dependent methyltransferase [Bacillota bacterium]